MSDTVFVQLSLAAEPDVLECCYKEHFEHGFDFNSIIPMPQELQIEESSAVTTGYDALYGDWSVPARYWTWKEAAASLGLPFPLESREELLACIRSLECAEMYLEPARRFRENLEKFGHGTWYGWCMEHWGTAWNAEDSVATVRTGQIHVRFTVAGAFPKKVLVELSKKWPAIEMHVQYADEYARRGRDYVMSNGREIGKSVRKPTEILESIRAADVAA